jgi:hypothetical protein
MACALSLVLGGALLLSLVGAVGVVGYFDIGVVSDVSIAWRQVMQSALLPTHPNQASPQRGTKSRQNKTTSEPLKGRLPNMDVNTLGLDCMLKGGRRNEEWGRAKVMTGWNM